MMTRQPVFAFPDTPILVLGDISIWTGTAAMDKVSKDLGVPPPKYACFLPVGTDSVHLSVIYLRKTCFPESADTSVVNLPMCTRI